jgi:hypothetical protein
VPNLIYNNLCFQQNIFDWVAAVATLLRHLTCK